MHFAPPSSLPRAAVGYSLASFFALSPRLIDRSRRKTLHTLQLLNWSVRPLVRAVIHVFVLVFTKYYRYKAALIGSGYYSISSLPISIHTQKIRTPDRCCTVIR